MKEKNKFQIAHAPAITLLRFAIIVATACILQTAALAQSRAFPDSSSIRGVNYILSGREGVDEMWFRYDSNQAARELDYAKRLNFNQARIFLSYKAWLADRPAFRSNVVDIIRICRERGIGTMLTLQYPKEWATNQTLWSKADEYADDLVNTVGNHKEPGLVCWDAYNEPPRNGTPLARHMAKVFRELDSVTPVTIGWISEAQMEAVGDCVDILSYHDYSPTRQEIDQKVNRAKKYAARLNKPLISTEICCVGRSNPYDVALEEYQKSGVGWYLWELMITKEWGDVHGIFYSDGTVRDPSIVAAVLGYFRNRGNDVVLEDPDREGFVTKAVAENRKWLADTNADFQRGLNLAERSANLLEAGQLVPMRELPTREVNLLRQKSPDMAALRKLIEQMTVQLAPYQHISKP